MPLFVLAGTWKDLWSENLIDVIPTPKLVEMIIFGLNTASTRDLVLKYLPREQKGLTDYNKKKEALRRALCEELGISNSFYRALKASGGAHKYQQLMSANRWDELDFNMFPSRALEALNKVSKKDGRTIVQRHGIEDAFASWLYSRDSVNFTGYPYELILKVRERRTLSAVDRALVNKQYEELKKKINNSGKGTGVLPVIDTSGSMFIYRVPNSEAMAIDVALSLGILLSDSLEGPFNRHFIGFSTTSTLQSLEGADFYSMATGLLSNRNRWMGSTNFASVIDLLVDLRNNNPEIPVSEFPTSLVVISDMQFNPTAKKNYFGSNTREEDNSSVAQARLDEVGLGHIQLIWWYVAPDRGGKPSHKYEDNRAYISGYDGSVVNVITGLEQKSAGRGKSDLTSEQLMIEALSQELYLLVD